MSDLYSEMWPAFYAEVSEQLDELEIQLATAEAARQDVAQAFRLFHTIKSSAAMMDFTHMETLAHAAEDILDPVRSGEAEMTDTLVELLSRVAARLKAQLAQADETKAAPGGDDALLKEARAQASLLGHGDAPAPSDAGTQAPTDEPGQTPSEANEFTQFADILDAELGACAPWIAGDVKRAPKNLRTVQKACEEIAFPALVALSAQFNDRDARVRQQAAASFVQRLEPLCQRAGRDCGRTALLAGIRPLLAGELTELALPALESAITADSADDFISRSARLNIVSRLCGYPSLSLLLRFVEQILLEVARGNLALPEDLGELMLSAYSLCLEVDPAQAEDDNFSEICGRLLTTLQDMSRQADSHDDAPDARDRLIDDFDIPYSLVATLHEGCLPEMVSCCENGNYLLDIEVDMDGPDSLRESFLDVIGQSAKIISNRTVFASDKPGDLTAETTRLSIIAACSEDPGDMITRLHSYHTDHFHLSVQQLLYRGAALLRMDDALPEESAAASIEQPEKSDRTIPDSSPTSNSDTLRISSGRLDQFVTRVGELVLLRNQMAHHIRGDRTEALLSEAAQFSQRLSRGELLERSDADRLAGCIDALSEQLERLTHTDDQLQQSLGLLQSDALDLRVVPVDTIFRRVPILVRRLARQLDKDVELKIEGNDVRIDKSMVEVLSEPLVHMVRNSLDHGLEPAAERQAAGKPARASLTLRAAHQGGSLLIELIDDGRGLNDERIRDKAVANGLVSAAQASQLSADALHALIFEPGFSTAESVSETSGRGVGMDVVKTRVEQLGGAVSIQSSRGQGCHLTLRLPLSAAIQGIVLFSHGNQTYGISERSVSEAFEVPAERLQNVQGQQVILHREHTLPLYSLSHLLGYIPEQTALQNEHLPVMLVSDGRRQIGILVEQVHARQEIFVRDCHPDIAALPGVSSASILGNGEPVLILEASGLIDIAAQRAEGLARLVEA